jgi:hypothetical protein
MMFHQFPCFTAAIVSKTQQMRDHLRLKKRTLTYTFGL